MPLALGDPPHPDSPPSTPSGGADFAALYERHFGGVYDFVLRIVRDRDLAADVVQDSFAKAWAELQAGRDVKHFKAWMYAIARNRAIDELRRRRRVAPAGAATEDEALPFATADPSRHADPEAVVQDREMVELVWSSAAALSPDEYSLLDMHLRQGLRSAEIADALELSSGAVHTRLSRLRRSLEESVVSTLLLRRGSGDCAELAAIVAAAGGKLTPALRRQVRGHLDGCEVCQGSRRRIAAPAAIFGALAPIPALPGVRDAIWQGVIGSHAAGAAGVAVAGSHHAAGSAHSATTAKTVAAAAALVAAGAAAIVLIASGGASVRDPARAASATHEVGVASTNTAIRMRWAPGRDAAGYSVMFSRRRSDEPPARVNVRGTSFTSAPLAPGRWWFILRTHGRDGHWTDTLRRGPYVIVGSALARAAGRHGAARHRGSRHAGTAGTGKVRALALASASAAHRAARHAQRRTRPRHPGSGHSPPVSDGGPGASLGVGAPATPAPPSPAPPPPPPLVQSAPQDVAPPADPGGGGSGTGGGETGGDPGAGGGEHGNGDGGDGGEGEGPRS